MGQRRSPSPVRSTRKTANATTVAAPMIASHDGNRQSGSRTKSIEASATTIQPRLKKVSAATACWSR